MAYFDSFRPTLLQDLMARTATLSDSRRGPVAQRRKELEAEASRDEDRAESMEDRMNLDAERKAQAEQTRRMEQVRGEPVQDYRTRLENQAWNPQRYGEDYRSSFLKNPIAPESAAAADEERRRKRLMQSMAAPREEEY
jgi:hypothetical protein